MLRLPHLACASIIAAACVATSAESSSSNFRPVAYSGAGATPLGVATADFDGDGAWDIASANYSVNMVTISLNDGAGHFPGPAYTLPTPNNPWSIAVAQLTGDDRPDLAVACRGALGDTAQFVSVFENVDGILTNRADYSLGVAKQARWVSAADLDGDELIDLVVAQWNSNDIAILHNSGGTFSLAHTYAVGTNPRCVVAADIDNDDDLDLATTNEGSNTLSVLRNNGGGGFAAAVTYGGLSLPQGIEPVDLDQDGDIDFVVANQVPTGSTVKVAVFRNTGTGTFTGPTNFSVGGGALQGIASYDANRDGRPDIVVANGFMDQIDVLINQGGGALVLAQKVQLRRGSDPHWFAVHDFDGGPNWDADIAVSALQNPTDSTLAVLLSPARKTLGTPRVDERGAPPAAPSEAVDRGGAGEEDVSIYDAHGRCRARMQRRSGAALPNVADMSPFHLAPGIYFVRSPTEAREPRRLVVTRGR